MSANTIASIKSNDDSERLGLSIIEIDGEWRIYAIGEVSGEKVLLDEKFKNRQDALDGIDMMYGRDGAGVWDLQWEI